MRKIVYVLSVVLMSACSSNKAEQNTTEVLSEKNKVEPADQQPTNEPAEESEEKEKTDENNNDKWDALPSEWQMITNENEGFIRFRPCDAAIPTVSIDKKNNKVYIGYGQDGDELEIVSWEYSEEPFKDEVEYYYRFKVKAAYEDGSRELILNYNKEGVSGWSNVFSSQGPTLFVHKAIAENYPLFEQPCVECWGDDCDEE